MQALAQLTLDLEEISAGAVHLVDEGKARHLVLGGLAPDRFRLRLHAADRAVQHAGAVQHTHGTLHLDGKVDVAGGVDDIDAVHRVLLAHAGPETGRGGGGNGDAALLLLLHPVHHRGTIMHFTDFVTHTRIEQDTLGRRGLAGIDVRGNTDVTVALDGCGSGHGRILLVCNILASAYQR